MANLGFFEVILTLMLIFIGYLLYKKINRKSYLGEEVYKIREDYDSIVLIVLWIVIAIIFLLTIVLNLDFLKRNLSTYNLWALTGFLMGTALNGILKGLYNKELRLKGITNKGKVYYWRNMIKHCWDEDRLEILFKTSQNKTQTVIWFVKDEDMEALKSILSDQLIKKS
ncbi:hypothetical protein [Alkaliphilus transvaalensis]|uniref:hypothetical protein n=1 Tax=Alkaliphilus transvaalensis TaxID=114628 RepID=UPI00047AF2D3|nr:hypothetical protein [Alkaliphilus transvaalensis]